MELISLMHEIFDDIVADKIITCLEHPTARMLKEHLEYKSMLKFDPRNDWSAWQTLYGFAHIGSHKRHAFPPSSESSMEVVALRS